MKLKNDKERTEERRLGDKLIGKDVQEEVENKLLNAIVPLHY